MHIDALLLWQILCCYSNRKSLQILAIQIQDLENKVLGEMSDVPFSLSSKDEKEVLPTVLGNHGEVTFHLELEFSCTPYFIKKSFCSKKRAMAHS